jgi:parvulin-like peptidyl-prolyl isomerase
MRFTFPIYLLLASCVFAQQSQTTEIIAITPDTVIASINGQEFTAGEFERITQNLPSDSRALAASNPQAFLEQYAHSLTMAAEAEKAKLHEVSPYKEQLRDSRRQILIQAMMSHQRESTVVPVEELKKQFEANKDGFKQVRAKVIFISRVSQATTLADGKTKTATPEEIGQKVAAVAKEAKEGADFVQLARDYSDDRGTADKQADLPYPIRANATNIPAEIRNPLLAAKPGEVVGPIEHQTGFYFFRVEGVDAPDFDRAKPEIEKEIKEARVRRWIDEMKAKSTVKLDHDPFWKTFAAANAPDNPSGSQVAPAPKPAEREPAK